MRAMEISRTGLDIEWHRMEVIADNLANINTIRTPTGGPFVARQLVSGPRGDFAATLAHGARQVEQGDLQGVAVYGIEAVGTAPRIIHEPGNLQADADGNVAYPGIDQAAQMTLMVKTARAYEANIVAMNAARQMYGKALDLGGRS